MKVMDGDGNNVTGKFELVSTTTTNITTYKIKTAAEFEYTHNSSTANVYNFYMTVRSPWNRTFASPTNGSNLIVFAGALTNIAPVNTGASSGVTKDKDFIGEIIDFDGDFDNGSNINSKDGLQYTANAWAPSSGSNYFSLNEFTGELTKTITAPIGTYSFNLIVNDAWDGTSLGTGTLASPAHAVSIVIN